MKWIRFIVVLFVSIFVLWINLPGQISFTLPFSKGTVFNIPAPGFHFSIGGKRIDKDFTTHLGLDLKGGSHLVFEATTSKLKPSDVKDALNSARDVIERRVNLFGVSEPQIRTLKSGSAYRIAVDLPGVSDVSQAVGLIGQTAQLTFRELAGEVSQKEASTTPAFLLLRKETGLTGVHITKASVEFNPQTGEPEVGLKFTREGARLFNDITTRNLGKPVGIFLDTLLISAPTVQRIISDGNAVITGNFTLDQAKQLAIAINSGALPVPVKLVEQHSVGPTLGQKEVERSMIAGFTGLFLVMFFMVVYYGRLGFIACMGLVIYGLLSFAIFRAIPIVLTLPGIAGFILSIGMAVDSNILIFERIKEERRKGTAFENAIKLGFGRAIDAIKDANITTLLVSFILFNPLNWEFFPQFGLVRGFALTLAIGVATSLFTGVVVTRRLISFFYRT